ncbi:MAG: DUF4065 domain-containing protein [Oscillospiraceae bacterium]|nr:DUF4065 domain-containing protein [Oscillospiraceae bacterium]
MASVFDVAHWFLSKEPMNHKKLQKLCYYAQAWSMVLQDKKPLFDGNFEAWAHGPVNRDLWNKFKDYGYVDITKNDCPVVAIGLNENDNSVLECVWETYGDLTGFQLETITHEEEPWIRARNNLPYHAPSTLPINGDLMYEYYKSQYSGDGIGE